MTKINFNVTESLSNQITDRFYESEMQLSNQEFQDSVTEAIYEASDEGILLVDENGSITSHNQRFATMWNIPRELLRGVMPGTAIGVNDSLVFSSLLGRVRESQLFLKKIRTLYDNPFLNDFFEIELLDGRTFECRSSMLKNKDDNYLGRVWFFRDISRQINTENDLIALTRQDPLTGIANRRYFFERSNQEFARTQRHSNTLSILEFDIDYFKEINDQYGHAVGDEVIMVLCACVQNLLREADFFARIGGEEFAILLPDTNLEEATNLAERLRKSIEEFKFIKNHDEIRHTISIGVVELKPKDTCISDCLLRADNAMYRAKQNGRNRVEIGD